MSGRGSTVLPSKTPDQSFELYSVPSSDSGRPSILRGRDIGSSKQLVEVDTVLLCRINPRINRVWLTGTFSSFTKIASTEWIPFPKTEGLEPRFLLYFLKNHALREFLVANVSGVGGSLMRVSPSRITDYSVPFPPLPEQKRIVAKIQELFSDLDAGVEALKKAKAEIKRYRQSVLKSAFEGKLTEDWRRANSGKPMETAEELLAWIREERKKNSTTKTQRHQEETAIDTAQLPKLPGGWAWARLTQLVVEELQNGRSVRTSEAGFPVLRLTALRNGSIDQREYKLGEWTKEEAEPYLIREGDFFIARGNGSLHLVGRGGLAGAIKEEVAFPDTLIRVRFCSPPLHVGYFALLWNSPIVRRQVERVARTTAGIYKINQVDIGRSMVPVPLCQEQQQIVSEIERRFSVADEAEKVIDQSLKQAETLRQSILKKAFEGRLAEQDPNDEPAELLLERIRAEREHRGVIHDARTGRGRRKVRTRRA